MNLSLPSRLTVDEFLAWAVNQPNEAGKLELLDGVVIVQQSRQWGHHKVKAAVFLALIDAIKTAGVPFYAATDGPTVRIDSRTAFEPDALIAPLPEPEPTSLEVPNPVIVVEVLSPSTAQRDATTKLKRYFEVPSVEHYPILDWQDRAVTHHKRGASGTIETEVLSEGVLKLDPPGIEIPLASLFGPAPTTAG